MLSRAASLKATYGIYVNVRVRSSKIGKNFHWMYILDDGIPFSRLSWPREWSPENGPSDSMTLQAEYYFDAPPNLSVADLADLTLRSLLEMGIVRSEDEAAVVGILKLPYANVIYDVSRDRAVSSLMQYVNSEGIFVAGRYGCWDYGLVDSAIRQAWKASEEILGA